MILENNKRVRAMGILGVCALAFVLMLAGGVACKKDSETTLAQAAQESLTTIKEGLNEFKGTVKVASSKYLYIPEIQGMDILVQGMPDLAGLEGKAVKVVGEFNRERPSLLVANQIDTQEDGSTTTVFNRTAEPDYSDYVDLMERAAYPALKIVNVNKTDAWEGRAKGKVFGKLQKQTVTEGGASQDVFRAAVNDESGKLAGYVILGQFTDYSAYYLKKLRLFDSFWFYLNIKSTVDAKTRVKTKDLFNADVACVGLF
ncbi:MAG: hypothetical protein MUP19_04880 [Candidatus Aminicenantes bacterium]|nr:hypothetical protein [Candidatus Aminicenantes bacterium]